MFFFKDDDGLSVCAQKQRKIEKGWKRGKLSPFSSSSSPKTIFFILKFTQIKIKFKLSLWKYIGEEKLELL